MVSRLALLQSRLALLRRLRAVLCAASALCGVLACLGMAVLAVFALDWFFALGVAERLFVASFALALFAWSSWRIVRSLGVGRESELDVALLVERQHDIDSDLVAALQFDRAGSAASESPVLASAVVNYVGRAAPQIDIFQGVSAVPLLKSLSAALAVGLVIASVAVAYPGHAHAFWNRLWLGSQSYPSRTQISQITIAQSVVYAASADKSPRDTAAAEGAPVEFMIVCTGALPKAASVHIEARSESKNTTRVELLPVSSDPLNPRRGQFVGRLTRLVEDATYEVSAGDARTPLARLRMTPLPIVDLKLDVVPPAYAAATKTPADGSGSAVLALEGSSLEFSLRSANLKPLKSVSMTIHRGAEVESIPLEPRDEQRLHWSQPANCPAFANLREDLKYEFHVLDEEGLAPLASPRGLVRVRPDAPPAGAIELVHRVVLPAARPVLRIRAMDDYGLAGIDLVLDVERGEGKSADSPHELPTEQRAGAPSAPATRAATSGAAAETHRFSVYANDEPVTSDRLPMTLTYALDLAPLALLPGDRLKLAAEITDYRGQQHGQSGGVKATTDSRLLEIADESGVLSAIREADQRTEQQLNELIRRELHLGETP